MNYVELNVTLNPFNRDFADIVMANLAELGFESFVDTEAGIAAYIRENLFHKSMVDEVLKKLSNDKTSIISTTTYIEEQNWNALWESNFEPITVEKFCRIRAPFHQPETGYKFEIVIEPKMSFGTGHHQTTWLMVRELFNVDVSEKRVLDMGCGTGILAIVAEKLGAKSLFAVDIDSWAVENTIENIARNNCSKINVDQGDVEKIKGSAYDIILANINFNVLMSDICEYAKCLEKDGILLVSGILINDIEAITRMAKSHGFALISDQLLKEWALLKFSKI